MNSNDLQKAIQQESAKFTEIYTWLEKHMPKGFFEAVGSEKISLVIRTLMNFPFQDHFSQILLNTSAIALCLDTPDADVKTLKHYRMHGISSYRTFISNTPLPGTSEKIKIALLHFTEASASEEIPSHFRNSLSQEELSVCLDMHNRAKTRDECQYEIVHRKDSQDKQGAHLHIMMAWRNVPKYQFLLRMAKVVYRHGLQIAHVNATYGKDNVMLLCLGLHGIKGSDVHLEDFLQELVTLKYFEGLEMIESVFVDSRLVSGNMGNLLKAMCYFIHQVLVHADINMYSFAHIEEGLCRHPELTIQLCKAFSLRFHPEQHDEKEFKKVEATFLEQLGQLNTGNALNDTRRKNILHQGLNFVRYTLKTNFFRANKTAFSFRLNPKYLDDVPYERKEKFPELPYAIFFMKGMHFFGFHIRFKDLARGGLRTVCPSQMEQYSNDRNNVFTECYGLSYTQQKKNKDIPEGGSKGIILLEPYDIMLPEAQIYQKELKTAGISESEIETKIKDFNGQRKLEFLYQSQRAYIESFMTLINCNADGSLKAKDIIDYYKKPEYVYLGPDENAHNVMLDWIASYSKECGYKPGGAFISSKPSLGINHKEFGVTSLGVNVYMEEALKFIGIDPYKQQFTVKMTGGPDGDVAGNEMHNLFLLYPKTAKLLAVTDGSGTIFDPEGLDLAIMTDLFKKGVCINNYPPEKLHDGGLLLDIQKKKGQGTYNEQSLCWKKNGGKLTENWLSNNEMNHLWRYNVLKTKTDVFIPAGGRPRTLNETNWGDFLDESGKPTSRIIVEGANLFLTPVARKSLEKLGVLIFKDSSSNKGGVICSSFEVLSGLSMTEDEFLREKPELVEEILQLIRDRARDEGQLLLRTHKETGAYLTDLSELVSERINTYMYELLEHLQTVSLSSNPDDPLIQCLLNYAPPLLRKKYSQKVIGNLPDIHKKAIIASYIAQKLVYKRGLSWAPSLVDVLPLVIKDIQSIHD